MADEAHDGAKRAPSEASGGGQPGKQQLKRVLTVPDMIVYGLIFMVPIAPMGIYGGVFTPTEAAAVAVFYGLFVGVFIYRTINSISILVEIFAASIRATAVVMLVVTCAGLFSWVASTVGLVEKGSAVLLAVSDNQWIVLLMINIILLLAGCCWTPFPSITFSCRSCCPSWPTSTGIPSGSAS